MTQKQMTKLFETLMARPLIECAGDQFGLQLYVDSTIEDLRILRPEIEEIERNSEARGRFSLWLEICDRQSARNEAQSRVEVL